MKFSPISRFNRILSRFLPGADTGMDVGEGMAQSIAGGGAEGSLVGTIAGGALKGGISTALTKARDQAAKEFEGGKFYQAELRGLTQEAVIKYWTWEYVGHRAVYPEIPFSVTWARGQNISYGRLVFKNGGFQTEVLGSNNIIGDTKRKAQGDPDAWWPLALAGKLFRWSE